MKKDSTLTNWLVTICVVLTALTSVGCQSTESSKEMEYDLSIRSVFERVTEQPMENLHFHLVESEGAKEGSWYRVETVDGEITVSGSSPTSLSYGAYRYLNDIGALSVSWEGKRVALPHQYEDYRGDRVTTPFDLHTYLNVCAYGYTMPWWDWDRWQKEIDWMALHGINNPVAMEGQEYVWQKLWSEFSISDEALADYFSGPAFTPWQRMGNIEGHDGPLPQNWINKKHQLQKKIITRMDDLGMSPVLPAFGGYVPKEFAEMHPDAKIYEMEPWSGFDRETYWIDPADPLFAEVAKRFIEIYTETYGESQYYLSDSFNEMLPPVSEDSRYEDLAGYGEAIYNAITSANPEATWVLQGWMFGADEEFWDLASVEAFLSRVPDDRVMIHDISNDRYAVWEGANAFYDKSWVFGFIHNYGGSNPIHANFEFYREQIQSLLKHPGKGNLEGFGVFPEGINNNSVAYEYLFDLPWQADEMEPTDWLERYSNARYGKATDDLMQAWSLLNQSVYQTEYWSPRWWEGSAGAYVLFKRPQIELMDFSDHPTDVEGLRSALDILLSVADDYQDSPLFMNDLVDWYRHYLSLRLDELLQQTMKHYQQSDTKAGDKTFSAVVDMTESLDLLLGLQQETLSSWIDDARAYARNDAEADYYERNAKQQITLWGGIKLKDYASKAWQGMYKDFYLPRWSYFIEELKSSTTQGESFPADKVEQSLIDWEHEWVESDVNYERQTPDQPIALMKSILITLDEVAQ